MPDGGEGLIRAANQKPVLGDGIEQPAPAFCVAVEQESGPQMFPQDVYAIGKVRLLI